ncbi:MAG: UPF0158 family protein [Propionibacteriaceae bacterium]|nr:UPF0158 family protein [Propionibacteriaceae bacterium]
MARTWMSVTVELLGGRGEDLWPYPGRVFAVGPRHTFWDLAVAINDAFARWDRSHLSMFTLADGRLITDEVTGAELADSAFGPITASPLNIETAKVARTVQLGEEFQFTFDLGDDWTHRCEVAVAKIDPEDQLGVVPASPLPYWGWGSIPDQYGRRWSDDDGEHQTPRRPTHPHPMRMHTWPNRDLVTGLDLSAVYTSVRASDVDGFLAAVIGCDIDDSLQLLGSEIPSLLKQARDKVESVALSMANRLILRAWEGDEELSEDLVACLRGEPLAGRVVPVDLGMLSAELEGAHTTAGGGFLDLVTGMTFGNDFLDVAMVGREAAIDVEEEPERWLHVESVGSREGWQDMADFIARQRDASLQERLQQAIEGRGAFRRFRDVVQHEDIGTQWNNFSRDRQVGRARAFLAQRGIRVGTPTDAPSHGHERPLS